ncbi:MAG: HAD-IA family hydrolase [Deltaproteobacteria bacterium]|nr:HAD-IA family hydrolase [Deltaproteobacteria bacterium]
MIKAILWDFGGVITTSPFEAFNRYEERHNIPRNFIRGINATNPTTNAWAQFESSRIDMDAFDRKFEEESRLQGHAIPGKDVLALLSGAVRPRMVDALRQCRRHFKTGCLTNNMKAGEGAAIPQTNRQKAQFLEIMALFDEVIESSLEGVRKPDPEIYRIALSRLDVNAEECVFLDDLGINLKPARAMGMQTIKVLGVDQALEALGTSTGLSFA